MKKSSVLILGIVFVLSALSTRKVFAILRKSWKIAKRMRFRPVSLLVIAKSFVRTIKSPALVSLCRSLTVKF